MRSYLGFFLLNQLFALVAFSANENVWISLINKASSHLHQGHHEEALSILRSFEHPQADLAYSLEAELLKAVTLFDMCRLKESLDVASGLIKRLKSDLNLPEQTKQKLMVEAELVVVENKINSSKFTTEHISNPNKAHLLEDSLPWQILHSEFWRDDLGRYRIKSSHQCRESSEGRDADVVFRTTELREIFETLSRLSLKIDPPRRPDLFLRMCSIKAEYARIFPYEQQEDFNTDITQAITLCESALKGSEIYQEQAKALFFLAGLYAELGQKAKSVKLFTRLVNDFSQSPLLKESYYSLGQIAFDKGEAEIAKNRFIKVLELLDETQDHQLYVLAKYRLAWCYLRLNQPILAQNILEDLALLMHVDKRFRLMEKQIINDLIILYAAQGLVHSPALFLSSLLDKEQSFSVLKGIIEKYLSSGEYIKALELSYLTAKEKENLKKIFLLFNEDSLYAWAYGLFLQGHYGYALTILETNNDEMGNSMPSQNLELVLRVYEEQFLHEHGLHSSNAADRQSFSEKIANLSVDILNLKTIHLLDAYEKVLKTKHFNDKKRSEIAYKAFLIARHGGDVTRAKHFAHMLSVDFSNEELGLSGLSFLIEQMVSEGQFKSIINKVDQFKAAQKDQKGFEQLTIIRDEALLNSLISSHEQPLSELAIEGAKLKNPEQSKKVATELFVYANEPHDIKYQIKACIIAMALFSSLSERNEIIAAGQWLLSKVDSYKEIFLEQKIEQPQLVIVVTRAMSELFELSQAQDLIASWLEKETYFNVKTDIELILHAAELSIALNHLPDAYNFLAKLPKDTLYKSQKLLVLSFYEQLALQSKEEKYWQLLSETWDEFLVSEADNEYLAMAQDSLQPFFSNQTYDCEKQVLKSDLKNMLQSYCKLRHLTARSQKLRLSEFADNFAAQQQALTLFRSEYDSLLNDFAAISNNELIKVALEARFSLSELMFWFAGILNKITWPSTFDEEQIKEADQKLQTEVNILLEKAKNIHNEAAKVTSDAEILLNSRKSLVFKEAILNFKDTAEQL